MSSLFNRTQFPHRITRLLSLLSLVLCLSGVLVPRSTSAAVLSQDVYLPGCVVASEYDATVPIAWYQLTLQLVRQTPGYSPPVASRTFGYLGVTLYEALVKGMPGYQSLAGQLQAFPALPDSPLGSMRYWPAVANAALAESNRLFFPTATPENLAAMNDLEAQFANQFAATIRADVVDASVRYGKSVAVALYEWSKSDGGHEGYLHNQPESYQPPTGDGLWVPTAPKFARAMQPTWGQNRPFVLTSGESCAPPPPPTFSTYQDSEFFQAANEVYNTVNNLTSEQTEIAHFWADDAGMTFTPPGHSVAIATQVLQQEHSSLSMAAITYAKVGMAVTDAFIGCWQTKFTYNLLRPITYIQRTIDPAWNADGKSNPLITPPFPSYPSGHSSESAAAMTVLTDLFGESYRITDRSHVDMGLAPRTFTSFMQAAEEAAVSRLYGGIHYSFDNKAGLQQGICVGQQVNGMRFER